MLSVLGGSLASALIIQDITIDQIYPGTSGELSVRVENEAEDDIENVVFTLDLTNLAFSTTGSSSQTLDELQEDDDDIFRFTLRADNSVKPGTYNIPYTLTYKNNTTPQRGTLGVIVSGRTDLEYSSTIENPIIGNRGTVSLKIINKGTGDARFVNFNIAPNGYTLLSEGNVYIGTVSADDFETINVEAIFNNKNAMLEGVLEYVDLDNNRIVRNVQIPLTLYTNEEAIQKGIIAKNNTSLYIGIVVIIVVIWLIWRSIAKRIRKKRSMQRQSA